MTRVDTMVAAAAAVLSGCAGEKAPEPSAEPRVSAAAAVPASSWGAKLGQTVTVEGTAEPRKLGAFLAARPAGIWIDGLQDWPVALIGKRVKVTGRVVERSDLPVFVQPPPGAPIAQGIPVEPGTDLERARHRFLLADAKWAAID